MHLKTLLGLTASSLVLTTTIGCAPLGSGSRPGLVGQAADFSSSETRLQAEIGRAVQAGRMAEAATLAEKLVAVAPRDAGYRTLLGDLYLKSGRFASAEAAFADVVRLDPSSSRAALSLALALTAQAKAPQALAELDRVAATAPAGDVGLAYALAGRTDRALSLLEAAAREPHADGRVRQNLALSYALAGDWGKARAIASQDVHPAELNDRLQSWADLANPANENVRVARLLGVRSAADPGQPVELALRDEQPEAVAVAAAAPEIAPVPKPVEIAHYPAPVRDAPVKLRLAAAAETLVRADPVLAKPVVALAPAPIPAFQPAEPAKRAPLPISADGRYVVQIGAYGSAALAEAGWSRAVRQYPLAGAQPHSTRVTLPGKGTFHRLSVAGFESPAEAGRLCRAIRAKGGACFVRTRAGDTLAAWAGSGSRRAEQLYVATHPRSS